MNYFRAVLMPALFMLVCSITRTFPYDTWQGLCLLIVAYFVAYASGWMARGEVSTK